MLVIRDNNIIPCDVDGTLVREIDCSDAAKGLPSVSIKHPLRGNEVVQRTVMVRNVQLVKDLSTRGRFVHVWSAAGNEWAEAVVRALELQNFVGLVTDKPLGYIDDLECQEFMGHRIFLDD